MQRITKAQGKNFSEEQILDWITQIALALRHCHDQKILHRDIKAPNVFMTLNNLVKLGDFGIAKVLSHTMEMANSVVGTPYYIAPELIQNKPYGFESDIWSMGVILYEMCALKKPFEANNISALALKVLRGAYPQIPAQYSKDLKMLVRQMLEIDPKKRPNIHKVLSKLFIINN